MQGFLKELQSQELLVLCVDRVQEELQRTPDGCSVMQRKRMAGLQVIPL